MLGKVAYAAGGLAGAGASLVAGSEPWQLLNNVSALVGLALFTLGLAYVIQVVNGVARERTVASQIAALGDNAVDAVAAAATASGLGTFPIQLASIASELSRVAHDHLTLPLLQFFHSPRATSSIAVNLARFDDILSVLEHGGVGQHQSVVRSGRDAVDSFLHTIDVRGGTSAVPPAPTLDALRDAVSYTPGDTVFAERLTELSGRRARLHAFVVQEGWQWRDVSDQASDGPR